MNTTAILETIRGYRAVIEMCNKYIAQLNVAIGQLEEEQSEFIFLWTDASTSHYDREDFKGENEKMYSQKVDLLMSSYSTYDSQIERAIEAMRAEIKSLQLKIEQYEQMIAELESLLG